MEEWHKWFWFSESPKKTICPSDNYIYNVSEEIVEYTKHILIEYGTGLNPTEGIVYWGGERKNNVITVKSVIAPKTRAYTARIEVDQKSNFEFVKALNKLNQVQVAQVHSHPGNFIDHSRGDDEWCAFKFNGLISIVVANYCSRGLLPLEACGIHRFEYEDFIRLSRTYIRKHFCIVKDVSVNLIDLRNE